MTDERCDTSIEDLFIYPEEEEDFFVCPEESQEVGGRTPSIEDLFDFSTTSLEVQVDDSDLLFEHTQSIEFVKEIIILE